MKFRSSMNKRVKQVVAAAFTIAMMAVVLIGCYKDTPEPHNPYSDIDYPTAPAPVDTVDPTSFVAIHRNILSVRCAIPGCHDGHFEPDYRTLQSSYSTLVYHPIIKNNADSTFQFRVIPFNKEESVLYERITNCCFVNQDDRMPQDNIGVPLESNHIANIGAWIDGGAKDIFGQLPSYPNQEPNIGFYVAINTTYDSIYSNNRINDIYYNPFVIGDNTTFLLAIQVTDDSTATNALQYNTFKMSYQPDNFAPSAPGYREYQANYFLNPTNGDEFFIATVNSADFLTDTTVFFRYFVNDGDHPNTQFPRNESIIQYKTFYSFYVTP